MTAVSKSIRTFGDLSKSRQNHFDLLRLVLALAVLYSHSYVLSGRSEDAVTRFTGHQTAASTFALFGFFVLSGYLIAGSWDRSRSWTDFAIRRARRILPGFTVAVLFCFLIIGPLGSDSVRSYFQDRSAWNFLTMFAMRVPEGVSSSFNSNSRPGVLNGSLWTIRLEISCYILLAIAGGLGLLRKRAATLALASGMCAIWIAFQLPPLMQIHIQSLYLWGMMQMLVPFAIGSAMYVWRFQIPASWLLFACSIAALAITAVTGGLAYTTWIAGSYAIILFGLLPGKPAALSRIGDLSYGVYLYAFPLQQLVIRIMHNPGPEIVIAVVTPAALALAWISWTFIELPILHRPQRTQLAAKMPEVPELASNPA